jgi:hypothetical protein
MHLNGMLGGSILASGLATRALFALLPGLLLLVALVGFLVKDPAIQQRLVDLIGELIPPLQALVSDSLEVSRKQRSFTIVGLVALPPAGSSRYSRSPSPWSSASRYGDRSCGGSSASPGRSSVAVGGRRP